MPGRARLERYVDHAGLRAGRGQPGRPAAPLPDQERPGDRRGRAPHRGARAPSSARPRPALPTGRRRTRAVLADARRPLHRAGLHRRARAVGRRPHRRAAARGGGAAGAAGRPRGAPAHRRAARRRRVPARRPRARAGHPRPGPRARAGQHHQRRRAPAAAASSTSGRAPSTPPSRRPRDTNPVLESVLADLAAEGDRLDALVAGLDEAGWRTPTPAAGWDVATQVAHLAWTDEAVARRGHRQGRPGTRWCSRRSPTPRARSTRRPSRRRRLRPADLLARWRRVRAPRSPTALRERPDGEKMPWYGPPMSPTSMATARFMETWAHSLDVHEALGAEPEVGDRLRHVAHLGVRTRDFAYSVHGQAAAGRGVPGRADRSLRRDWAWGPEDAAQRVTGSAYDFCLLVTQRIHRDDTDLVATGDDAEHWLDDRAGVRRPVRARGGSRGERAEPLPDRQLLRLLRRPALGDARDARGRAARRARPATTSPS